MWTCFFLTFFVLYAVLAPANVGSASTPGSMEVMGRYMDPVVRSANVPYSKKPLFIRKPLLREVREGDTVVILCEVTGDPNPYVYWQRDFVKWDPHRTASQFKRVGDGPEYRLELPHAQLEYAGQYLVVARNVHGVAMAIISLQIRAKALCHGDWNATAGCGLYCKQRCQDYFKDPEKGECDKTCLPNSCDCIGGYYYDQKRGICVRIWDCSYFLDPLDDKVYQNDKPDSFAKLLCKHHHGKPCSDNTVQFVIDTTLQSFIDTNLQTLKRQLK